jgi:hypothetical protein
MTNQAMRDALAHLRDGAEMDKLEQAARSRSEADWIVGMNATRAATIRLRSSFDGAVSLGRVQTPTLAIVARREEEIRAFKPEPYWLVDATFATPISLVGGTTYAIVLTSPGTTQSAHYEIGVLSDSYADGQYFEKGSGDPTWSGTATDAKMTLCFVPCSAGGCTLTQGFWKNHPNSWPVGSLSLGTTSYTEAQLISIRATRRRRSR